MADLDKFKRARQKQDFVQDTNSDVEQKNIKTVVTRNKSSVQLEENTLSARQRSRTKHGRNITVPLFHEELTAVDEAVAQIAMDKDISINNFIRDAILKEAKRILGKDQYETITCNKLNVVKNK